jgi:hypothetical protein
MAKESKGGDGLPELLSSPTALLSALYGVSETAALVMYWRRPAAGSGKSAVAARRLSAVYRWLSALWLAMLLNGARQQWSVWGAAKTAALRARMLSVPNNAQSIQNAKEATADALVQRRTLVSGLLDVPLALAGTIWTDAQLAQRPGLLRACNILLVVSSLMHLTATGRSSSAAL